MNIANRSFLLLAAAVAFGLTNGAAEAFESGSTGADGALNPSVNTQIQLPPNGVLNYTNVNIPDGVTVTFARNTTNTPVVLLVGGDATIAGTLDVRGGPAAAVGAAGDGNIGDDGTPGLGGPGGFDGGQGGRVSEVAAERESQPGLGPGGAGRSQVREGQACGGSGGGFATTGGFGGFSPPSCLNSGHVVVGTIYGEPGLLPLVGGSGGSGGAGGTSFRGGGGGGGGGGLLIAVSGTLAVPGAILANGGAGGTIAGTGVGAAGGGGSGGGIRLIATHLTGNGTISATGGAGQTSGTPHPNNNGGNGAVGRIRLEAEIFTRIAASTPPHSFGEPGPVFVAGLPTLRISKVAGIDAPAEPTGNADIALPEETVNPVEVEVATTGVPLGNTVTITVTPAFGATGSFLSTALSGSVEDATATAQVTLPTGPSALLATVSYDVPAEVAQQSPYRELSGEGDPITRIALQTGPDGALRRTATTRSGREIELTGVALSGG